MNEELEQFLIAQQTYYRTALQEIKSGQKRSCWMWFIFPQIAGLGYSETARYYAIKDLYHKYESITADAGYENEENYLWMEKEEIVMCMCRGQDTMECWQEKTYQCYRIRIHTGCLSLRGLPGILHFVGKCTRSKKYKQLYVSKVFIEKREVSLKDILSSTGRKYRMNRSIQVEGAFGVLKYDYGRLQSHLFELKLA